MLLVGALASALAPPAGAQKERRIPRLKPAADSTLVPTVGILADSSVRAVTACRRAIGSCWPPRTCRSSRSPPY